jgi:hypothetical protein
MSLSSWVSSSFVRHFPLTPPQPPQQFKIDAALNEQSSFQVAVHWEGAKPIKVQLVATGPQDWQVRVRRVGYVPVRHRDTPILKGALDADGAGFIPGFVPDPLFDEDSLLLPEFETHAFWITVRPAANARPGLYEINIVVSSPGGDPVIHQVYVRLHNIKIQPRQDFPITHWFYVDSLIDWYKTDLFDERFWSILAPYFRNIVEHGQDTLLVPVFTPSLDGVKRPSQLLSVHRNGDGKYEFDWRDVRRYIRLAREMGIQNFEWAHFFTQWGSEHPVRIYEGQGRDEQLLWDPDIPTNSPIYRTFLAQYLPQLERFLAEEGIAGCSFFHVSDEPHGEKHMECYRQARNMLRELAPWMRVMDALSDIEFARQGLVDTPVPSIQAAMDFVKAGIPSWVYYCVGPTGAYLNRLLDTPLAKLAMHGFLFYRWPFHGFLHWGYNYWYQELTRNLIDPYTVQDALHWEKGWVYGDSFMVYPGPDGPVDSLRWEIIGESLQDYTLMQTLGVDRSNELFAPILNFCDFPNNRPISLNE